MNIQNDVETLEDFVISILEEETSEQKVFGHIVRFSEDNPSWYLFLLYEDLKGEKYYGGHYPLTITDMDNLVNIFTMFSEQERRILVDTVGYFTEN